MNVPRTVTVEELAPRIPGPVAARGPMSERCALGFRHGSTLVERYGPGAVDSQQPHPRDERYIIASGRGAFECDEMRVPFAPHEVLFVRAGEPHRFVDYTEDFRTWVVFYGPEGGEAQAQR